MQGFGESVGVKLEKADYVSRVLTDMARRTGYQQIAIPIVEVASSFSEEVVGESPWPGFNEEGCFHFEITDYGQSYDDVLATHRVLLVPEGTTSITRWLGNTLDKQGVELPLQVFYHLKCFRNELISSLSNVKGREFTQFGTEIMGDDSIMSEVETIRIIILAFESFGIMRNNVHVRLNDISIFNMLVEESGLEDRRVVIKEQLDSLAGVKAGKRPERYDQIVATLDSELSHLNKKLREKWNAIIFQQDYSVEDAIRIFGDAYERYFSNLVSIREAFALCDVQIDLDLCVIRSHEYYTSVSFEVDVVGVYGKYAEIAGGGRYDRLVSNFIHNESTTKTVPCVGFAFGMERFIELLDSEGVFQKSVTVTSRFEFTDDISDESSDYIMTTVRSALFL